MNIQNITAISLILVTTIFNMHAMETPHSDTTQKFVNALQDSEFQEIILTPKFQSIPQGPEFLIMMQTPQFQNLIAAIQTKSHTRIQETLEELLETKTFQLLFETEFFSNNMVAKYNAMRETEAYQEYQGAKKFHEALTQEIIDDCKTAWRNTEEYKNLIDAANQEMFISNNSINKNNNTNTHDFSDMEDTEIYRNYQRIKQFHEKHNTLETDIVMQEALKLLLEAQTAQRCFKTEAQASYTKAQQLHATYNTPETQIIMQEGLKLVLEAEKSNVNNNSQDYSNDVKIKHRAMQNTKEYFQYEAAKLAYKQNPDENTAYMVKFCKEDLYNTQECQAWIRATDKEQHVTRNITNSQEWETKQSLSWQSADALLTARNNAWIAVQNTEEYENFKKAEFAHKKLNNIETAFLLKKYQADAKQTLGSVEFLKR